jgi:rubrerythrin
MSAQTTRNILDQARYFHQQLQAFYEVLRGKIEKPKLQLILDYLAQHEKRMEKALEEYEDDVAGKVANTWFKYSSENSMHETLKNIKTSPDMTLDELMTIAIQLENHFVNLYRSASEQAVSNEVKDVFEKLLKETMRERMKISRDLVDMNDL